MRRRKVSLAVTAVMASFRGVLFDRVLSFRYGACIPSTCTRDDLDILANYCKYAHTCPLCHYIIPLQSSLVASPAGMKVKVHSCKVEGPLDIDTVQIVIMCVVDSNYHCALALTQLIALT